MEKQNENNNFAILALVAIVAVIGVVSLVMIMSGSSSKNVAMPNYIDSDGNVLGQPISRGIMHAPEKANAELNIGYADSPNNDHLVYTSTWQSYYATQNGATVLVSNCVDGAGYTSNDCGNCPGGATPNYNINTPDCVE